MVEPQLKEDILTLSEAVNVYHIALTMKEHCIGTDDLSNGRIWSEIETALVGLGVADYIETECKRQKEQTAAKRAADQEAKKRERELKRARKAATSSVAPAASTSAVDDEVEVVLIKDKDGNEVPVESILQKGQLSSRV